MTPDDAGLARAGGGSLPDGLDPAQHGVGDMDAEAFRRHGAAVIDWIADYLEGIADRPVLAQVTPGQVRGTLPAHPPSDPEPFDALLHDLEARILPGVTHWNHPSFHAYFAITGSGAGILAEAITAALNVNGMLWRTSPSATELEQLVLDWLRQLLGLPAGFDGIICDTASMSTMLALAAARERTDLDIRQRGLAGRTDVPPLRVYTSEQAHSSVEKAAIALGLGRDGVRTIAVDDTYRMRADLLAEAMREDVRFGYRPLAIVPTVGTTATTSIDPVPAIADVRDELVAELGHDIWLHVDGAYGGMLAVCEERRGVLDGVDQADSFVTNPHKWLFTPIDCSALYLRDPSALTDAFTLVPEYLTTTDDGVTDYMDWGVQLGRRFRALKLWFVIRYFGSDGLAARIREHVAQAQRLAERVTADADLVLAAPVPMSTVCLRADPAWLPTPPPLLDETPDGSAAPDDPLRNPDPAVRRGAVLDELNRAWMARVNASGEAFVSHAVLDGRVVLRLATGSLRTTDEDLARTWARLRTELDHLRDGG
ncbi:MAG: aspartate aminotransferase family protein [Nitriliruptoraceae bacterium]|nr:aspartate aminotransferase family protein [Nitriliruptoraceae bacterium]